ncbi:MAG: hypothetical protein ACK5M0_05415 [Bacteroidales bacterium]
MKISDDQNTITIDSNTYEAAISECRFCQDCQLKHVLQYCDDIPCRSYERKDKRIVVFKKKSDIIDKDEKHN